MLTSCQKIESLWHQRKWIKSGKFLVHVLFHCIWEKKSISILSFFLLHLWFCPWTCFLTYKKSIFLATFFICITRHFSKFTFCLRLLSFIFWQYETRSRTEEKAFWRSRPINRHIFVTYFHKIFLILVYVSSLCWYLSKIK